MAHATVEKELETLREENSRLKERVKILQEGDSDDITRKVEQRVATSNSKEVQGNELLFGERETLKIILRFSYPRLRSSFPFFFNIARI